MKNDQNSTAGAIFSQAHYGPERYFMTQEDQDAVVGRIVRERRDIQQKLAVLEAEAQRLGALFNLIGRELQRDPTMLIFENHPAPAGLLERVPLLKPADINAQILIKLVDDMRETKRALENIQRKARELGI